MKKVFLMESAHTHIPVLAQEIVEAFRPVAHHSLDLVVSESKDLTQTYAHPVKYFDGTFGRGGHYRLLKQIFTNLETWAMDQDQAAFEFVSTEFRSDLEGQGGRTPSLHFFHKNYAEFATLQQDHFDMMLLDLGVSSPQLDEAKRGFSFYHDGPLDMRMDQRLTVNASTLLNTLSEEELNQLFKEYGEIYKPYHVTRAVCHDRKETPFTTTRQLASLIERVDGWRKKGQHPATQYFMALRLVVNHELEVLSKTLPLVLNGLKPGGRLCVITFHSLEDRIVKNVFKGHPHLGAPVNKKVIIPQDEEMKANPRSRSAKLRVFERARSVQDEPNNGDYKKKDSRSKFKDTHESIGDSDNDSGNDGAYDSDGEDSD